LKRSRFAVPGFVLAFVVFAAGADGIAAAKPVTDEAEDILLRYAKLVGGHAGIDHIQTMVVEANYFYPNKGDGFEALFYWKRPDLTRVEFYQKPLQVMGYDGKKAWIASLDPDTRTVIKSADLPDASQLAANFKRNPGFESLIGVPPFGYKKMGITAVVAGMETIAGAKARKVRLTWPDGHEKNLYFDLDNGYLVFEEQKDPKGLVHTSSFSDYRARGGLFVSCFRVNKGPLVNGEQIVVQQKIVELRTNEPVVDSLFIRPEIK